MAKTDEQLVFILIQSLMKTVKDSGASMEEAIAAIRATEAILPISSIKSRNCITFR